MKVKKISSKTLGELTGKLVAGAKALPAKTSETTGSIKDEFIAGFIATSGANKTQGQEDSETSDNNNK
jgi:hypothetical protein